MIREMCDHSRFDKTRNEVIRGKVKVASIEYNIRDARHRWFSHMKRRSIDASVRRCEKIDHTQHIRGGGRPKKSYSEVIKHDLKTLGLVEDMAQDRRF